MCVVEVYVSVYIMANLLSELEIVFVIDEHHGMKSHLTCTDRKAGREGGREGGEGGERERETICVEVRVLWFLLFFLNCQCVIHRFFHVRSNTCMLLYHTNICDDSCIAVDIRRE